MSDLLWTFEALLRCDVMWSYKDVSVFKKKKHAVFIFRTNYYGASLLFNVDTCWFILRHMPEKETRCLSASSIILEIFQVKVPLKQVTKAQAGNKGTALLFLNLGARCGWLFNATPRPLYRPRRRPSTHCTGGWVGHRSGLDGRRKSRLQRDFCFFSVLYLYFFVLALPFVLTDNTHNTNIHVPGEIQTCKRSMRSAAYPRLRTLGLWDRQGFDPRTVQPVASLYTDWVISAHEISGISTFLLWAYGQCSFQICTCTCTIVKTDQPCCAVLATSAKLGLHANSRQTKKNQHLCKRTLFITTPVHFSTHHVQQKCSGNNKTHLLKIKPSTLG